MILPHVEDYFKCFVFIFPLKSPHPTKKEIWTILTNSYGRFPSVFEHVDDQDNKPALVLQKGESPKMTAIMCYMNETYKGVDVSQFRSYHGFRRPLNG